MAGNSIRIVHTRKASAVRMCKHVVEMYAWQRRNISWVCLRTADGEKINRCEQCIVELVGFFPVMVRVLRKKRKCKVCGQEKRVIGFLRAYPKAAELVANGGYRAYVRGMKRQIGQLQKEYVCFDCFKRVGETDYV